MAYNLQPGDTLHGRANHRARDRRRVFIRTDTVGWAYYTLDENPVRIAVATIERWLSGKYGSTVRHVPKGLGLPDGV